jgi:hypothetical protein
MNKINYKFRSLFDKMNEHQNNLFIHPYTCLNDGDETHIKYEFEKEHKGENYDEYIKAEKAKGIPYPEMAFTETNLIVTEDGFICPCCDYTQKF